MKHHLGHRRVFLLPCSVSRGMTKTAFMRALLPECLNGGATQSREHHSVQQRPQADRQPVPDRSDLAMHQSLDPRIDESGPKKRANEPTREVFGAEKRANEPTAGGSWAKEMRERSHHRGVHPKNARTKPPERMTEPMAACLRTQSHALIRKLSR
jgi:hypothetical protein